MDSYFLYRKCSLTLISWRTDTFRLFVLHVIMYFSVNCNGRSLMNSFIIPSLQAMNKVTNVRDAYKKASALRKSCFLKEIDEEQELPPYLESYLVPGEMHHTYWNQFSDKNPRTSKKLFANFVGVWVGRRRAVGSKPPISNSLLVEVGWPDHRGQVKGLTKG